LRIVLDPAAVAETREAALFYEDCREGLGQEFLLSVEAALAAIAQRPTIWRRLQGRFHRCLVHRSLTASSMLLKATPSTLRR